MRAAPPLQREAEHNLLPRLRFFQSIGFSGSELPELLSYNPTILFRSLEKRIIPHYEALKSVIGDDDVRVRRCLKSSMWHVFSFDVSNIVPNIKVLRDTRVPQTSIFHLLSGYPNVACIKHSKFVEYVDFVKGMGIKPSKVVFVEALAVALLRKSTWELKLGVFGRFGWSRDGTLLAFSKTPKIMALSEKSVKYYLLI